MPPPCHWEIDIPHQLQALMHALDEMDRHLLAGGATPAARDLGRLVVEELGTNVIKRAGRDQGGRAFCLVLCVEGGVCGVNLEDDGPPFNPCQAPEPDSRLGLAERGSGGWGLAFVRRLVSTMDYRCCEGRNRVSVRWPRELISLDSLTAKGDLE